jgi:hypothetical protein
MERVRSTAGPVPEHRWGLGAFLSVFAVLVLSAVVLSAILPKDARPGHVSSATVLVGTIAPTVIAAVVAVVITRLRGNGPVIDFGWRMTREDLRIGFKLGAAGLVLTVVAVEFWSRIVGAENATSTVGALVDGGNLSVPASVVMFLYTWLLGPFCEEIIFRGMCWGAVARWGPFTAFVLSTAIFAASHLEPIRTSLLLVITAPIGLGKLLTGRLGASVIAHQVNNFLPAVAVLLMSFGVM